VGVGTRRHPSVAAARLLWGQCRAGTVTARTGRGARILIVFGLASTGVFNRFDLAEDLGRRLAAAEQTVERMDADVLLSTPVADLVAKIVGDCDIEPPQILWDEAEQLPTEETQLDMSGDFRYSDPDRAGPIMVSAARITIAVPVAGEAKMLGGRAHTWLPKTWPDSKLVGADLHIWNIWTNPSPDDIRRWWATELDNLRRQTEPIQNDISAWRTQLPARLTQRVEARRQRLLRDRGLEGAIGLRLRTRETPPRPVPVRRTKVATTRALRQNHAAPYVDEPALEEQTYAEILDIICSFGRGVERSPRVARKYDEEELRDQILMHLNGHFEGEAGGELFNGAGKTDITVRHDDRNVFIGECKFWAGHKAFTKAIDQLNGYLVFRDTKAAIVLFIKQRNPSTAIDTAISAIKTHPQFKREGKATADRLTLTHHVLRHSDDALREVQLALIPVVIRPESRTGSRSPA
jgi:hypothetical protein